MLNYELDPVALALSVSFFPLSRHVLTYRKDVSEGKQPNKIYGDSSTCIRKVYDYAVPSLAQNRNLTV